MRPGRELDGLIAEKVMGWTRDAELEAAKAGYQLNIYDFAPKYSTDIAAAWKVLEKMHSDGFVWCIEQADTSEFATVHIPSKQPRQPSAIHFIEDMERTSESAESPPHAICLAALKAVEYELADGSQGESAGLLIRNEVGSIPTPPAKS